MSYSLQIVEYPTYLHAIVTGENTKENVTRYLEEIQRECAHRKRSRVLIEERLEGARLGVADVFQIASQPNNWPSDRIESIAYVDVNAQGELMKFAENVAVNRGRAIKVFASVDAAKLWIA